MIHYTRGDILKSEAEALASTVNCVSVMGHGVDLAGSIERDPLDCRATAGQRIGRPELGRRPAAHLLSPAK